MGFENARLTSPARLLPRERPTVRSALNAIRAYLDPGESAVGTAVNVRHLAATPVGRLVTGEAEVTKVDGRQIEFAVRATEGAKEIGAGSQEGVDHYTGCSDDPKSRLRGLTAQRFAKMTFRVGAGTRRNSASGRMLSCTAGIRQAAVRYRTRRAILVLYRVYFAALERINMNASK